ncbi:MAG: iron uptake porin [Cyanobacteria bacterium P01_G01_bin.19]
MIRKKTLIYGVSSLLGLSLLTHTNHAFADAVDREIELLNNVEKDRLGQVTNVNQLRDVSPTDWSYEALRSLVDRYGCISGFPNQSYRGDRPLSRYEFAAGLNSCLNQIERLIASSASSVSQDDLDLIGRLSQEFEAELASIGERVNNIESNLSVLEDNQFSTTAKLKGQAVFSATSAFGDRKAVPFGGIVGSAGDVEDEVVFDSRLRLNFDTSFTGKDLLKVRLDSINATRIGNGVTGTNMTRLAFDRPLDGDVRIGKLFYRFGISKLRFTVDATRGRYNANVSSNFNKFFANPVKGSISNFGRFNPIYAQGAGGSGVTAVYKVSDAFALNAGYLARNPNNPNEENGLFDGSFAALAQVDIKPTDALSFGLTYVRAYYPDGRAFVSAGTGSRLANAPFGNIDTAADHFGLQTSLNFSPVVLSGWAGYTLAEAKTASEGVVSGDRAKILNWAVSLAFPDLGGEGNVGGIIFGQQPRVLDNDTGVEEDDANWHLQAQYRYKLRKGISINPGFMAILNPENNSENDTVYVGTIRTIFEF